MPTPRKRVDDDRVATRGAVRDAVGHMIMVNYPHPFTDDHGQKWTGQDYLSPDERGFKEGKPDPKKAAGYLTPEQNKPAPPHVPSPARGGPAEPPRMASPPTPNHVASMALISLAHQISTKGKAHR